MLLWRQVVMRLYYQVHLIVMDDPIKKVDIAGGVVDIADRQINKQTIEIEIEIETWNKFQ